MNYNIRPMQMKDINQVQSVAKTSWNATYEGIIPYEIQESFLRYAYNDVTMIGRMKNSLLLVAESNAVVIGFANFFELAHQGQIELAAIYLDPAFQGKGIGTALLNEGINSTENVKELYINVEKDNEIGKGFYLARGFKVVKEFEEDFDGHKLQSIRMMLEM